MASEIGSYLSSGGNVMFVGQTHDDHNPAIKESYNNFLSAIGSTIQFGSTAGLGPSGELINTGTPIGAGVSSFDLNGWTQLVGGTSVVTISGVAGVAYEEISITAVPIPAAVWLFGSALGGLGWFRRRQTA
jgi:hypothetical protein